MDRFRPKYVTFDCRGTLINFQMAEAARDLFGHLGWTAHGQTSEGRGIGVGASQTTIPNRGDNP